MNGTTLIKAFVALPGGAKAVYTSAGLMYYQHSDWLGSSRLTSTATSPTSAYFSTAYAPFGEQYATSGTADASFTGQGQDTMSTLYDFTLRRQSPSQGRWVSPDPAGMAAVDPTSPQSWNRYAHALNNPLSLVDPLGLEPCGLDGSGDCPMYTDDGGGGGGSSDWDTMNALWWNATFSAANGSIDLTAWDNLQDMMVFGDNYFNRPGYANEGAQAMLRYLDPCVYTNDNGSYNTDDNSSPQECKDTGGHWVPPGWTFTVDNGGNVNMFASSSQCSVYLQGGTVSGNALNFLCRSFPDNPWSQSMRACLQTLYDPNDGYVPFPLETIPGMGAHVACALVASGVQ